MKVTPDELRQYYASLSDEMLLRLDPADLTDAARRCYESEFAERGLTAEAGPLPADEDVKDVFEVELNGKAWESKSLTAPAANSSKARRSSARFRNEATRIPARFSVF